MNGWPTGWQRRASNGIAFFVAGRPQGKGRPRFTRQGHTYTPDATRTYEERVKLAYKQAGGTLINGAVFITIRAYFTPPKSDSKKTREQKCAGNAVCTLKPDVDNVAKIIMDGLNGVAFSDDKQVVSLRVTKTYKPCEAGCWVYVISADEWEGNYDAAD